MFSLFEFSEVAAKGGHTNQDSPASDELSPSRLDLRVGKIVKVEKVGSEFGALSCDYFAILYFTKKSVF